MAIIAGTSWYGTVSELTIVTLGTRNPSNRGGTGASGYDSKKTAEASIETGTNYIGSSAIVFSPELAALFSGDDL